MGDFFLYLPIYYAHSQDFFNLLPDNYEVNIVITNKKRTDDGVFHELLGRENKEIKFALCDPKVIFNYGNESIYANTAVLAALISNSAFWVMNHRVQIERLSQLSQFKQMLAFKPGTTSYAIAKEAQIKIITVDSPYEISSFRDYDESTVTLTPSLVDVLRMTSITEDEYKGKYNKALSLSDDENFSGILTTALMTRQDIILEEKELVVAVLAALQHTFYLLKIQDQDILSYSNYDRFGQKPDKYRREALDMALDEKIYPETIKINKASWRKAARCFARAQEHYKSKKNKAKISLNNYQEYADKYFNTTIKKYFYIVDEAIEKEKDFRQNIKDINNPNTRFFIKNNISLAISIFIAGFAISNLFLNFNTVSLVICLFLLGVTIFIITYKYLNNYVFFENKIKSFFLYIIFFIMVIIYISYILGFFIEEDLLYKISIFNIIFNINTKNAIFLLITFAANYIVGFLFNILKTNNGTNDNA